MSLNPGSQDMQLRAVVRDPRSIFRSLTRSWPNLELYQPRQQRKSKQNVEPSPANISFRVAFLGLAGCAGILSMLSHQFVLQASPETTWSWSSVSGPAEHLLKSRVGHGYEQSNTGIASNMSTASKNNQLPYTWIKRRIDVGDQSKFSAAVALPSMCLGFFDESDARSPILHTSIHSTSSSVYFSEPRDEHRPSGGAILLDKHEKDSLLGGVSIYLLIILVASIMVFIRSYFAQSSDANATRRLNSSRNDDIAVFDHQGQGFISYPLYSERAKPTHALAPEKPKIASSDIVTRSYTEEALPQAASCASSLKHDFQFHELTDENITGLVLQGKVPWHSLEKVLKNTTRAVKIRRDALCSEGANISNLPYEAYNYDRVFGACCENVIGYVPLPLGLAGPLVIDGFSIRIPMATTEGALVASTSRGCKAINGGTGVTTALTSDKMTRAPCISFPTLARASCAKSWLDSEEGQLAMKNAFNSTSRFASLQKIKTTLAGNLLYMRFEASTGDAMGMNMISRGVEYSLYVMSTTYSFTDMTVISVSGNFCTDKKAAAINWIEGRGKSVVAEANIPASVVRSVLKVEVGDLIDLNTHKNYIGSAMAGSIGGFNAHAANIVTAVFLATGQDPAQNVESSNCITMMKKIPCTGALQISVSMPCIEVGTIGGGTILDPQGAMLGLLGVRGAHPTQPGENARKLSRIVAAAVLAGELSLCAALTAGDLVKSHMAHNRSRQTSRASSPKAIRAQG